jgi:RsmE family RNA methyltransferase
VNLILLHDDDLHESGTVVLADRRARHAIQVLHVADGDELRVGRVNGPLGRGVVVARTADRVTLRCQFQDVAPPRPGIDLILALPRPKVLKRLWPQLAALGVRHIALTNAERVERDYFDSHVLAPGTYVPLLLEGLEQAQDTWLPTVSIHKRFRILVEDELAALATPDAPRLVAHAGPDRVTPRLEPGNGRAVLAVGPEGGWNAFELDLLARHRFERIALGGRTLRTDTACIALLSRLQEALAHPDTARSTTGDLPDCGGYTGVVSQGYLDGRFS